LIKSLDYDLRELREFLRIKNLRILFFLQKIEIVSNKNKILFIKVKKEENGKL